MTIKEPVPFRTIDPSRGDELFRGGRRSGVARRWGPVMASLMAGETVFVPGINRNELEAVRSMLADRTTMRLRSTRTWENDEEGYLLRLVPR